MLVVALSTALVLTSAIYAAAAGGGSGKRALTPANLGIGKRLYRKYCGQCHALNAALAAGFGSDRGLGTDGGPSFNNLRVGYNLSIVSITQPFIGHEVIVHKMRWTQIKQVSAYVAEVTKHHEMLALPTDG